MERARNSDALNAAGRGILCALGEALSLLWDVGEGRAHGDYKRNMSDLNVKVQDVAHGVLNENLPGAQLGLMRIALNLLGPLAFAADVRVVMFERSYCGEMGREGDANTPLGLLKRVDTDRHMHRESGAASNSLDDIAVAGSEKECCLNGLKESCSELSKSSLEVVLRVVLRVDAKCQGGSSDYENISALISALSESDL